MDLQPGLVLAGFRLERELGRGAQGVVFLASHLKLGRTALKILLPTTHADPKSLSRFQLEARLAAQLHHPNIVDVYDFGSALGHSWLSMRYIDGTDCRALIRDGGPLMSDRAVDLVRQAGEGLDYAHRCGVVHRDIKPANLLVGVVDDRETVWVSDFGIADSLVTPSGLTSTGDVPGTAFYLPPERLLGQRGDGRTDVYALGCTLFYLLTGHPPFPMSTVAEIYLAHIHTPPPRVSFENPAVPAGLDEVIAVALSKDPADRYPTCQAMTDAAVDVLRGAYAPTRANVSFTETSPAPAHSRALRQRSAGPRAAASRTSGSPTSRLNLLAALRRRREAILGRRLRAAAFEVGAIGPEFQCLSDAEIRSKTGEFSDRHAFDESADELMLEGFAAAAEASQRVLGWAPTQSQIMAAIAVHVGCAVRVPPHTTAETLILPAYLNALVGGVHVFGLDEDAVKSAADRAGRVFDFLGLSIGVVSARQYTEVRANAYAADITYGTMDRFRAEPRASVPTAGCVAFVDGITELLVAQSDTRLVLQDIDVKREMTVAELFGRYGRVGGVSSDPIDLSALKRLYNMTGYTSSDP